MFDPSKRFLADGITLRTVQECRERVLRHFALEEAREEARISQAQVYRESIANPYSECKGPSCPRKKKKKRGRKSKCDGLSTADCIQQKLTERQQRHQERQRELQDRCREKVRQAEQRWKEQIEEEKRKLVLQYSQRPGKEEEEKLKQRLQLRQQQLRQGPKEQPKQETKQQQEQKYQQQQKQQQKLPQGQQQRQQQKLPQGQQQRQQQTQQSRQQQKQQQQQQRQKPQLQQQQYQQQKKQVCWGEKDTKALLLKNTKKEKTPKGLFDKSRKNQFNEKSVRACDSQTTFIVNMCELPPAGQGQRTSDTKTKPRGRRSGSATPPVTPASPQPRTRSREPPATRAPRGSPYKEEKTIKNISNEQEQMSNKQRCSNDQQQMRGQKRSCTCPGCSGSACGGAPNQGSNGNGMAGMAGMAGLAGVCAMNGMSGMGGGMGGGMNGMTGYACEGTITLGGGGGGMGGNGGNGVGFCDELEAIEEEHDPEVQFSMDMKCGETQIDNNCNTCNSCPKCNPTDDDACGEFFEVMRDSMEDAVKKSLEGLFARYFSSVMEKLQCMATQMEGNECVLTKIFTDLNDKISYYGERNAQQFQYLCVRMEHDRLFYQQQQEYFLKQSASNNSSQKEQCCPDTQPIDCGCGGRQSDMTSGSESESRHKKGRYWDCTLEGDEMTSPRNGGSTAEEGGDEDDDAKTAKNNKKGGKAGKPVPSKSDTGSKKRK